MIYAKLFFLQGFFFIEIQKIKESSVQNETMKTLYKLLNHFQEVYGCHLLVKIHLMNGRMLRTPRYMHMIQNIDI